MLKIYIYFLLQSISYINNNIMFLLPGLYVLLCRTGAIDRLDVSKNVILGFVGPYKHFKEAKYTFVQFDWSETSFLAEPAQ